MDLEAVRETATGIIRQAGREALHYFNHPHTIDTKSSVFDIVTEADKAVEKLIFEALLAAFPDHHIVGEESGGVGAPIDEAAYRWYVDPIDGTSNFAHHIPFFSISIAMTDRDLNPLLGLVLDPVADSLFSAVKGGGTTLNGAPVQVAPTESLEDAIFVTGFPYDVVNHKRLNTEAFLDLLDRTQGVRRFGSAALELSFVASGRFDGFWETGLKPWDCMAGILIVREAGGRVTDYTGGESALDGKMLVASNGHMHQTLIDLVQRYP